MPARLKSYSCSNCGGVLNVDRDEDIFDCPFCGARFDVMDFHKRDILDEVHELWERKDFAAAKKKLDNVLPADSDDYELLCAYALSIANLTSFTNLDKPKKINLIQSNKLYELLEKDERYSSGIPPGPANDPYFRETGDGSLSLFLLRRPLPHPPFPSPDRPAAISAVPCRHLRRFG